MCSDLREFELPTSAIPAKATPDSFCLASDILPAFCLQTPRITLSYSTGMSACCSARA